MTKLIFFGSMLIFFFACGKYPAEVCKALEQSGDNRYQLEKLLAHYAGIPGDSLKLRAAEFLIANMPGHYSIAGEEVERYAAQVDSMYPNLAYYLYPSVYLNPYYRQKFRNFEKKYDLTTLSAAFLIKNIDFKFALRDAVPWGSEIPFDLFCETILPYRCDVEPLKDISQDSLDCHLNVLKKALSGIRDVKYSMATFRTILPDIVFATKQCEVRKLPSPITNYSSDCTFTALNNKNISAWNCIPLFMDETPHWAAKDNRHCWNKDAGLNNRDCQINEITNEVMAKVYRKTFSQNDYTEGVFSTRFLKDVTNEYLNCHDVVLDIKIERGVEDIYLAVFNEQNWRPVAWGKLQGKKVIFKNLAQGVLYMPIIYQNENPLCISYPFYLDVYGCLRAIKCDPKHRQKLHLVRKYPIYDRRLFYIKDLVGIAIEASNNVNFSQVEQIDSIQSGFYTPFYQCNVKNNELFRYWRIRKKSLMTLSELRFYDDKGLRIKGTPITKEQGRGNVAQYLFDDDLLTCEFITSWVGVDFGLPINILKIEITPQTDANNIYPGDVYELRYHDGYDWVSHEIKEATDYYIEFEEVPSGALYWLRNLTEGKEERPFTVQNGQVIFW